VDTQLSGYGLDWPPPLAKGEDRFLDVVHVYLMIILDV